MLFLKMWITTLGELILTFKTKLTNKVKINNYAKIITIRLKNNKYEHEIRPSKRNEGKTKNNQNR